MGQTHVHKYLQPLLDFVLEGHIDPSFVITHRLSLADAAEGYKTFKNNPEECFKVNWGLIGELAKNSSGTEATVLKEAHDQVEPEEDEHLYHTSGWTRELWIEALGMPAVLPPPEQDVETAIEAAQAKKSRAKNA